MTTQGPPYGEGSAFWLVHKEAPLLVAGGRALLLQLAHPGVAAGVDDHSDFRQHPLRRLWRTLDGIFRLAFADPVDLREAARQINQTHRTVRGPSYQANDPALLLWVLATLIDSGLEAYARFFRPLTPEEREAYYREWKSMGVLLGLPMAAQPESYDDFALYWAGMLDGEQLRIDDRTRSLAADVLRPRVRAIPAFVWTPLAILTAALLPERLREAYRLPWRPRQQTAYRVLESVVRASGHLPAPLRELPIARRAARRSGAHQRHPVAVGIRHVGPAVAGDVVVGLDQDVGPSVAQR